MFMNRFLLVAMLACFVGGGRGLQVGETLPVFSLTTPDGKVLKSEALKGKVLLLDFWATWCAPCRKLTHEIDSTFKLYQDGKDIRLIGVDYNETPVSTND